MEIILAVIIVVLLLTTTQAGLRPPVAPPAVHVFVESASPSPKLNGLPLFLLGFVIFIALGVLGA